MLQHFLEQINNLWEDQKDDDWSFMYEITVCKELGEILKKEGFDFVFNPNTFNGIEDGEYYTIPVYIDNIDEMFSVLYE